MVLQRTMQLERNNIRAAQLEVVLDAADNRVLELNYSPLFNAADTAAVNAELTGLATKWDKLTKGVRAQSRQGPGPYTITWTSPDSLWTGQIFYSVLSRGGAGRPTGFAINERKWQDRIPRERSPTCGRLLRPRA